MIAGKKILGLIPARGGSKGLPGKNTRSFCGRPLISWTIDAALESGCIDALVVTTDDRNIAEVARASGAEVPFLRPPELATDTASSIDVAIHAIDWLQKAGHSFDMMILLEPTSPLREASDIKAGISLLLSSGAGTVVGVCRAESAHPAFMYRRGADGRLTPFLDAQPTGLRRQDIEPVFYLEGTLYVSWIDVFRSRRSFYHDDTVGYEVPKWKSIEIDDMTDFVMAEAVARHKGLAA